MKKTIFLIFLMLFAFTMSKSYAAQDTYYSWIMGGYGYSQSVSGSWQSYGPIKVTVGGLLWRYVGMELAADTSWKNWGYNNGNTSWTLDLKPYVLIQSTLGNRSNALIPYVGIAPVFSIAGVDYESKDISNKTTFDVGVAAKGGLRVRLLNALMFGLGIEYVYHHNSLPATRNMSQFNAVAEVGFSW